MQLTIGKPDPGLQIDTSLGSMDLKSIADTKLCSFNSFVEIAKLTNSLELESDQSVEATITEALKKLEFAPHAKDGGQTQGKTLSSENEQSACTFASSLSLLDLISPKPHISFSADAETKKKGFKCLKLIEELYESEEAYVTSLTLLLNYYIEPLMYCKKMFRGQFFHLFCGIIQELINVHTQSLEQMRAILKVNNSFMYDICVQVTQVVLAISKRRYIYELYCNQYERILNVIKSACDVKALESQLPWLNGWSNYLEATQPVSQRKDLTFLSLIQKPTTRLGKYRLLLEAIAKSLNPDKQETQKRIIHESMSELRANLKDINRAVKECKVTEKIDLLKELIKPDINGRDVYYFGRPLLVGCLFTIWVSPKRIGSADLGIVLFKTHILLFDLRSGMHKYETLFSIPLSSCQFQATNKDFDGGLHTDYRYCFKLIFEEGKAHYELLLGAIDAREYKIYHELLSTLIDVVNGPCPLKFDAEGYKYGSIELSPYDVSPNNNSQKSCCYFRKLILVNIYSDLTANDEPTWCFSSFSQQCEYFRLSRSNRLKCEKKLAFVWSEDLPLISKENSDIFRNTSMPHLAFLRTSSQKSVSRHSSLRSVLSSASRKNPTRKHPKTSTVRDLLHQLLPGYYSN